MHHTGSNDHKFHIESYEIVKQGLHMLSQYIYNHVI